MGWTGLRERIESLEAAPAEVQAIVGAELVRGAEEVAAVLRVGTPIRTGATAAGWRAVQTGPLAAEARNTAASAPYVRVDASGVPAVLGEVDRRIEAGVDSRLRRA